MGALLQPYSSGKQRHSLTVALFDCKYPQSMQNAVLATAAIRGSVEPQAAGSSTESARCENFIGIPLGVSRFERDRLCYIADNP